MLSAFARRPDLLPSLAVAFSGLLWGLFWIPIRYFDAAGLRGAWSTLAYFVVGLAILLPLVAWHWRRLVQCPRSVLIAGVFTGSAFALYALAILLTDVVRVMLLFYATPVWSTILAAVLLRERITLARLLALVLGLGGLVVILGFQDGFPMPRNLGDWLALAAGITWSYGTLMLYSRPEVDTFDSTVAFFVGGLLVAIGFFLVPIFDVGDPPSAAVLRDLGPSLVAMMALLALPAIYIALWGSGHLDPGRVGILLMGEILVGVGSAAILTDEPFGLREAVGTALVISAGLVEILIRRPASLTSEPAHTA